LRDAGLGQMEASGSTGKRGSGGRGLAMPDEENKGGCGGRSLTGHGMESLPSDLGVWAVRVPA